MTAPAVRPRSSPIRATKRSIPAPFEAGIGWVARESSGLHRQSAFTRVRPSSPGAFLRTPGCAPVAQLDRASDYESEGWRFDSFRARHYPSLKTQAGRRFRPSRACAGRGSKTCVECGAGETGKRRKLLGGRYREKFRVIAGGNLKAGEPKP